MTITDKGVLVIGVNEDTQEVLYRTPDGTSALAYVSAWFGRDGRKVNGPGQAFSFCFEVVGTRYDVPYDRDNAPVTTLDGLRPS